MAEGVTQEGRSKMRGAQTPRTRLARLAFFSFLIWFLICVGLQCWSYFKSFFRSLEFWVILATDQRGIGKAVPLHAWSDPEGSKKLRFPDYMTTAHGDGEVVSLTHRPRLPPGNIPGTHFCQRLSRPQGHSAIGRIMSMKNSNDTIWNRTSDLPICSTAP